MANSSAAPRALPGGLWEDRAIKRDFAFRPLDGALELALAEVAGNAESTPAAVTQALTLALHTLGGSAPTLARVNALCVADRQFLMRCLRRHLGHGAAWLTVACGHCKARFDLQVDSSELPVTAAGNGYPFVDIQAGSCNWRARLPNGDDQIWLARQPADAALTEGLLKRVLVDGDGELPEESVRQQIDDSLDAIEPALVMTLAAQCPECNGANTVALDPYDALATPADDLLLDVHRIASHYHWGEADILRLPQSRRRAYLDMIEQGGGSALH